uniref:Uncharacterized protein n=1 Tax=Glossina brevipalpis TaxID=37001 RepID=A0A1A9X4E7_9MUSC
MGKKLLKRHFPVDFLGQSSPSGMDAIFVVWNEFIQKIKLALLLPIMVENYKILRKCLLDTKYECISRLVEQFCAGKKDIAHDVPKCISQGADKIVEIVLTNPGILNYLPKAWFDDLSPNELKLLKCLEDIFELVQVRFPRGAFEQMDMDHEAFKNYHANKSVTKDIICKTIF